MKQWTVALRMPGMPDHTDIKWLNKFATSINDRPDAKNLLHFSTDYLDKSDSTLNSFGHSTPTWNKQVNISLLYMCHHIAKIQYLWDIVVKQILHSHQSRVFWAITQRQEFLEIPGLPWKPRNT